jgi:hypothetical protein
MNKNHLYEKNVLKVYQESVKKRKNDFEIAYLMAWNFQNKFKNNFKPNDWQKMSKNSDV